MPDCKSTDAIEDFCNNTLLNHVGEQHRHILSELVTYLYGNAFHTVELVKSDIIDPSGSAIREYFFVEHKEWSLFSKIKKFVKRNVNETNFNRIVNSKKLKDTQNFSRLKHFEKRTMECIKEVHVTMPQSMNLSNISEQTKHCKLNALSHTSKMELSEFVITKYHQQCMNKGWSVSDFLSNCALLRELSHSNKQIYKIAVPEWIKEWIKWYQTNVYKPLPRSRNHLKQTINHDINIVFEYLKEINDALYEGKCFMHLSPFQLDVYFVPSFEHSKLISELSKIAKVRKYNKDSDFVVSNVVCGGVHTFLRDSVQKLKLRFGDRVKLVIVRENQWQSDDDIVYLWRSEDSHNVSHPMSQYSEITWIDNTKADIVSGLNPEMHGILTVSHHLHSDQCERVYSSFEDYGSRVFKRDMINQLPTLFKHGYDKISPANEKEFINDKDDEVNKPKPRSKCDDSSNVKDFRDPNYTNIGEYWFGTYECFDAEWNDDFKEDINNNDRNGALLAAQHHSQPIINNACHSYNGNGEMCHCDYNPNVCNNGYVASLQHLPQAVMPMNFGYLYDELK